MKPKHEEAIKIMVRSRSKNYGEMQQEYVSIVGMYEAFFSALQRGHIVKERKDEKK